MEQTRMTWIYWLYWFPPPAPPRPPGRSVSGTSSGRAPHLNPGLHQASCTAPDGFWNIFVQKYFLNTSGVPGLQPASEPGGVVVVITRRLGTFVIAGIKQSRGYLHLSPFTAAAFRDTHLVLRILYCIVLMQKRSELLYILRPTAVLLEILFDCTQ